MVNRAPILAIKFLNDRDHQETRKTKHGSLEGRLKFTMLYLLSFTFVIILRLNIKQLNKQKDEV